MRETGNSDFRRLTENTSLTIEQRFSWILEKFEATHIKLLSCLNDARTFFFCRGDLAITLLVHYKDEPKKVAKIMDKLLDRDVHQLIKSPILSSYYSSNPPTKSQVNYRCYCKKSNGSTKVCETNVKFVVQLAGFRRAKACSSPLVGTDAGGNCDSGAGTSSRPHSSTSAELESGISTLTVQPQPTQPPVSTRTKETRWETNFELSCFIEVCIRLHL